MDLATLAFFVSHMPQWKDAQVVANRDSLMNEIKVRLQPSSFQIVPRLSCRSEILDLRLNWDKKTPGEKFDQFHLIMDYEAHHNPDPRIQTLLRRLEVLVRFMEADTTTLRTTGYQLVHWLKFPEEYSEHVAREAAMSGIWDGLKWACYALSGPLVGWTVLDK